MGSRPEELIRRNPSKAAGCQGCQGDWETVDREGKTREQMTSQAQAAEPDWVLNRNQECTPICWKTMSWSRHLTPKSAGWVFVHGNTVMLVLFIGRQMEETQTEGKGHMQWSKGQN